MIFEAESVENDISIAKTKKLEVEILSRILDWKAPSRQLRDQENSSC